MMRWLRGMAMPNFGNYINWNGLGHFEEWYREFDRGDSVAFMIGHRGVSLVLTRGNTTLAAQDMLLAPLAKANFANEQGTDSGIGTSNQVLVLADDSANMQRGDRFSFPVGTVRLNYEIIRVEKTLAGQLQGIAEEVQ